MISELLSLGAQTSGLSNRCVERRQEPEATRADQRRERRVQRSDQGSEAHERTQGQGKAGQARDRNTVWPRGRRWSPYHWACRCRACTYRYDDRSLANDLQIGPANKRPAVEGGVSAARRGEKASGLRTDVAARRAQNKLEVRSATTTSTPGCPSFSVRPRSATAGAKPRRDYRGLRKTWIAEDLTRKSRTQIKPAEMVRTPIPSLGLPGLRAPGPGLGLVVDAGVDARVRGDAPP